MCFSETKSIFSVQPGIAMDTQVKTLDCSIKLNSIHLSIQRALHCPSSHIASSVLLSPLLWCVLHRCAPSLVPVAAMQVRHRFDFTTGILGLRCPTVYAPILVNFFAVTSLSISSFPLEVIKWGLVLQLAEILNQGWFFEMSAAIVFTVNESYYFQWKTKSHANFI